VDNRHVLKVKRSTVVFVAAELREFTGAVGVVEAPELVRRQGEALVAEEAVVVVAKLCEVAEEGGMATGGIVLGAGSGDTVLIVRVPIGRVPLSTLVSTLGKPLVLPLVGASGGRIPLSA